MKAYGTKSPYYEERKAERTTQGDRPVKKGNHMQEHRVARKRARRDADKQLDEAHTNDRHGWGVSE